MAEGLQLTLLGNLEVLHDGLLVTNLRSRKAMALLCYLAVTGRPHLRPLLVGLLWGEMPEVLARNNLSKALTHLRRVVGQHLRITRQEVAFDRGEPYWLDVEVFEQGASALADIEQLQRAVELYRGDFLEGFYVHQSPAFEEWVLAQRARLRELALQALHTLAAHHTRRGPAGNALATEYTTHLLVLEPWREEAHRQMMLLLAASGQRGAALAQYEACRELLAEELGVEPAGQTTRLYEQIRDGELEIPLVAPMLIGQPEPAVQRPSFLDEGAKDVEPSVFVARERELARLDKSLKQAIEGNGHVLFATGGPGRGKTALLSEFARRAMVAHPALLVASGSCNAYAGAGDPYLPFREVMGMLTGDVEPLWSAGAISRDHALRLWHALPIAAEALLAHGPHVMPALVLGEALLARAEMACPTAPWLPRLREQVERRRAGSDRLEQSYLFQQVTNLLRALAEAFPLLLILDDLQWTDTASIGLLFHLARHLEGCRILVAGAYRPEELALGRNGAHHPLAMVLAELKRRFGDVWVDLAGVQEPEGQHFVDAFLETEPNCLGEDFRRALFDRTGGHPLFTVELLRTMQERGDLVQDEIGRWVPGPALAWEALPARVGAVIEERIGRLEEDLREVLSVASVEGEEFTAQVVARVQDIQERRLLRALSQELEKRHRLVRERAEARVGRRLLSRYRFAHNLFQKYLYNDLSAGERRLLHGEIAAALEELFENRTEEIVVQLAFHYRRAEVRDKALSCLIQAGHQAQDSFANEEALGYYTEALRMMPGDGPDRFDLLAARAAVYHLVARYDEQRADVEEMLALAEALDDDARRCDALIALSLYYAETDLYESRSPAQEALEIAERLVDPLRQGRALRRLGTVNWDRREFHQSRERLEAAIQVFADEGLTAEEARCWHMLSITLDRLNETDLPLEAAERSVALSQQAGDRRQEAIGLRRMAIVLMYENRYAEALPFAWRALALHRKLGDRGEECPALNVIGMILGYLGEYEASERFLVQSLGLGESSGSSLYVLHAAVNLVEFHNLRRGDLQELLAFLAARVEKALLREDDWLVAQLRIYEGRSLRLLGQYEAGQQVLALASRTMDRVGSSADRLFCGTIMGELQALAGDCQRAMETLQLVAQTARETRDEANLALALCYQGECALREGRPETMQWGLEQIRQGLELISDSDLTRKNDFYTIAACLHLALAEIDEALDCSSKAVQLLESIPNPWQPERTLFIHSRALQAVGRHEEADEYLKRAYERVMLVAGKTRDEKLRRGWLENVQVNREILAACAERGIGECS